MKKLQLSLLFSLALLTASSQKVYFVYVQADPEQAFFVKMNERVQSSTSSGYIILSKMVDSTYQFSIGFPQNKWPEQYFSVVVNKKDHGYLLKNFGDKGWGLFDLQTLAVQMGTSTKTAQVEKGELNKDVSAFTDILSKAADDPSLKERPVQPKVEEKKVDVAKQEIPKKEEPKVEKSAPVITKPLETAVAVVENKEVPKPVVKETVTVNKPVVEKSIVKKEEAKETKIQPAVLTENPIAKKETPVTPVETKETVVVNKPATTTIQPEKKEASITGTIESKADPKETVISKPIETIEAPVKKEEVAVSIMQPQTPVEKGYKPSEVKKVSEAATGEGLGIVYIDTYDNGSRDTVRVVIPNPLPAVTAIKEEPKEDKKFIEAVSVDNSSTKTVANTETGPKFLSSPPIGSAAISSNCKEVASESDFFKLRKTMASARRDDDMLSAAKKYFKAKCYSASQVKNLSTLFLNDEAKYKFFDLAYQHVSDAYNFPLLGAELRDEYYLKRFQAMLHN